MKIINLSYYDQNNNWSFENLNFPDLALLVGVSGVGKTKILKSIYNLRKIANGESIKGIKWNVLFETTKGKQYFWEGEFENKNNASLFYSEDTEKGENKPLRNYSLIFEKLLSNNNLIAERKKDAIFYLKKETVKLSSHQSLLALLKETEITDVQDEFNKIIRNDERTEMASTVFVELAEIWNARFSNVKETAERDEELIKLENDAKKLEDEIKQLKNEKLKKQINDDINKLKSKIMEIKNETYCEINKNISKFPTIVKVAVAYKIFPLKFKQIKELFIEIFEQVEDIKVDFPKKDDLPDHIKKVPVIQIKEKFVDDWILQYELSSGMFKTLIQISQMILAEEGSVFLIDEFENSLGINCINVLTNDLLCENNSQCILTSHHPYIINSIDMKNWNIVTRKGGKVSIKNSSEFNLGKSKHEAFIQLINLPAYKEGIDIE